MALDGRFDAVDFGDIHTQTNNHLASAPLPLTTRCRNYTVPANVARMKSLPVIEKRSAKIAAALHGRKLEHE